MIGKQVGFEPYIFEDIAPKKVVLMREPILGEEEGGMGEVTGRDHNAWVSRLVKAEIEEGYLGELNRKHSNAFKSVLVGEGS